MSGYKYYCYWRCLSCLDWTLIKEAVCDGIEQGEKRREKKSHLLSNWIFSDCENFSSSFCGLWSSTQSKIWLLRLFFFGKLSSSHFSSHFNLSSYRAIARELRGLFVNYVMEIHFLARDKLEKYHRDVLVLNYIFPLFVMRQSNLFEVKFTGIESFMAMLSRKVFAGKSISISVKFFLATTWSWIFPPSDTACRLRWSRYWLNLPLSDFDFTFQQFPCARSHAKSLPLLPAR